MMWDANQTVAGSNPAGITSLNHKKYNLMEKHKFSKDKIHFEPYYETVDYLL